MEDPMADDNAPGTEKVTETEKAPKTDKASAIDEEAFNKFKECAVEVLHVKPEKVTPDASFADDLDADSLDLVELVMALEEQFGITVDESELEGVSTVGQAFELVSSKL
jgi:acyl carrier protein